MSADRDAQPKPAVDAAAAYANAAPADDQAEPEVAEDLPVDNGHHQVLADLDELTEKAAKAEEYLGLAQRTKADFENFRRRAARDAALAQERGITKLAKELLPAIDNLDRAVRAAATWEAASEESAASHEAQLHAGLELVHAEVLAALARVGIEPFAPTGETFDPTLHEAVAQTPIEGAAAGTVAEVYQQGYRLGETVLRPARVLVAS
jgi:molecular chaperone GrpE